VKDDGVEEVAFAAIDRGHERFLECGECIIDGMVDRWVDEEGVDGAIEEGVDPARNVVVIGPDPQEGTIESRRRSTLIGSIDPGSARLGRR
jgi:hypothetical protein